MGNTLSPAKVRGVFFSVFDDIIGWKTDHPIEVIIMINIHNFVENLTHDEMVRLNASLRFFLGYDNTKRDAYVKSLTDYPETENELIENINAVFSMSGIDFFNNVSYFDRISG